MVNLYNYTCSYEGLLLPVMSEYTWPIGVRIFLYLIAMFWCFMGTSIVADSFMCGIEKITSKTKIIRIPNAEKKEDKMLEVKVWNDTVANLSLMAFGTSAPEILLSVIEIVGNEFKAGELGPGTIVGSAAFNLLVITGICVICIPDGEIRKIKSMPVYITCTCFSMCAYIWMVVVLKWVTPGVVDIFESVITFCMFPILLMTAFGVDKGCWCKRRNKTSSELEIGIEFSKIDADDESEATVDIIHMAKDLSRNHKELTEDEATLLLTKQLQEHHHHNAGWYRVHAVRGLTGGHRLLPKINHTLKELYEKINRQKEMEQHMNENMDVSTVDLSESGTRAVVEFTASSVAVLENEGKVRVGIRRYGKVDIPVTVRVETIDGSAEEGSDYKPLKEDITFAVNERLREVYIEIIDDDEWEPDEIFFVKLSLPHEQKDVVIGKMAINQITIINDDEPGKIEFSKPSYIIRESNECAQIFVNRVNGADGTVTVRWRTKDLTAVHNKDYTGGEGTLTFEHGETSKTINLKILETDIHDGKEQVLERDHSFQVELFSPSTGSSLGKISKAIVTLVNDTEFDGLVSRIANQTKKNLDGLRLDTTSWKEQFNEAMNVNGGDIENATLIDYVLHFISFFWKVLFAFIPPPSIAGGYLTFFGSLALIGLMTALISDLASIFGCLIGLEKTVVAITFVALGTSMPDTFASKTAAINEKYADSSIGNINGSNAVNVFLGLGLPWLIASIYWEVKGESFTVPADTLVFSVILYSSCAILAILVLLVRRKVAAFGNGELGGPKGLKIASGLFLVTLWFFYVIMSSLQAYKVIDINI
ncbi:sodium/calcium exchanger 3-like isoform X1 [Saccostrea echinata]|uniref:sodium/calcium exchanger 3-like isoform X1 n=1 Tax=Saccostrea echinata TaxID=191078 RepID=UPI002A7ECEE1|nr:sodium/calcium exchanger 3-like isoform X1 [Saccostrea echinata]